MDRRTFVSSGIGAGFVAAIARLKDEPDAFDAAPEPFDTDAATGDSKEEWPWKVLHWLQHHENRIAALEGRKPANLAGKKAEA